MNNRLPINPINRDGRLEASSGLGAAIAARKPPAWLEALREMLPADSVLDDAASLWVYSRDRAPYSTFSVRHGRTPAGLPAAIACPANVTDLQAVVRFARERAIPLLPYGAGSGVLGGAIPLGGELLIDLKRLNAVVDLCEDDCMVTVEAGINGAQLESWLNARGFTTGHHPQSLHMSTVGGWVVCRGAGQSSTRYGKIEDMVLGLEVILPDGRELRVAPVARRSAGPSIKDLFVGSEGVLGFVTRVTLRVWPLPEHREPLVLAFPSLAAGFTAMRHIMQAELRPAILRLYDEHESASRAGGRAPFGTHPVMAILEFAGARRLAAVERDLALEIACRELAQAADHAPYLEWLQHRYVSTSVGYQSKGWYADTLEVTGRWSTLAAMNAEMAAVARAAHPRIDFGAHWSHAYAEGACQYMTMRLPPMSDEEAMPVLSALADRLQGIALAHGGSISHHHGIGLLRGHNLPTELGIGHELLVALKDHLDPKGLLSPGKLGFPTRGGQ